MKKYFALFLLSFVLVSCGKQENQPMLTYEVPKNTEQEVSENKGNLVAENSNVSSTEEIVDSGSGDNIESIKVENIFETHLDSLMISISGSLLDKNTFNNFINDGSGGTSVGKLNDWIKAFQVPCSDKSIELPIYNYRFADSEIILESNRYCSNSKNYNQGAKQIFDYLTGKSNYTFQDLEFNTGSLNGNRDSTPNSPLEKLIATQIFSGFEADTFITATLYKKQIITLFASTQEEGLPYYKAIRIYSKDNYLYVTSIDLDIEQTLDTNYGNNFGSTLWSKSYHMNNSYEYKKEVFSEKENNLLKGHPSKIQKKINSILIQELTKLIE